MTKILNEILQENPELRGDENKIKNILNDIDKINPKILIGKDFKKSLKLRLEGLIGIKKNIKSDFSIFMIPIFSFIFIFGGIFYVFQDISFTGKPIDISNINKISEESFVIQEVDEIGDIFKEELEVEIKSQEKNLFKENVKSINIEDIGMYKQARIIPKMKIEDKSIEEELEDNQVIELFESIGIKSDSYINNEMGDVFIEQGTMKFSDIELDFILLCYNAMGKITGSGELEKCIIDKKECLKTDFENGICDFR